MVRKGENPKAAAARERDAASKAEKSSKASKAAQDAYWQAAGEGHKSKAQAKREEQEQKKQEAAAKKLEAKRAAEAEEAMLSVPPKSAAKAPRVSGPKVTAHELELQRERDAAERAERERQRAMAVRREVSEDAYERLVGGANTNRDESLIEASGVEAALSVLAVDAAEPSDKHPEKRMKAAWLAFHERELPVLKQQKPNLKASQYKDMLWKMWQKSPDNPLNQAARA